MGLQVPSSYSGVTSGKMKYISNSVDSLLNKIVLWDEKTPGII